MPALDDAIAALERLGGRLDACRSAGDPAVESVSDALAAAAAFGLPDDVAALEQLHDDLAEAAQALAATGEQTRRALDRLLALRGDAAGGHASSHASRGRRQRQRRRAPGAKSRPAPAPQGDSAAFRNNQRGWRAWGTPGDHVATFGPKIAGFGVGAASVVGLTRGIIAGLGTLAGVFALDLAATVYEKRKAARRRAQEGD